MQCNEIQITYDEAERGNFKPNGMGFYFAPFEKTNIETSSKINYKTLLFTLTPDGWNIVFNKEYEATTAKLLEQYTHNFETYLNNYTGLDKGDQPQIEFSRLKDLLHGNDKTIIDFYNNVKHLQINEPVLISRAIGFISTQEIQEIRNLVKFAPERNEYFLYNDMTKRRTFAQMDALIAYGKWLQNFKKKSTKTEPKTIPFEKIFTKPEYAAKVIEILKNKGYLDEAGKWNGTRNKVDFKYMFMALKNLQKTTLSEINIKSFYVGLGFKIVEKIDRNINTPQILMREFTGGNIEGFEPPFNGSFTKENKYQMFYDWFIDMN